MKEPLEILKEYWNHDHFRPYQKEIIDNILDGQDTVALLPTGGGKSICFQIPALLQDGICIVISPLIALMKDQVDNLSKRGIKALSISAGISSNDLSNLFDNCQYGNYKFLYLSPERLQSAWVIERIRALNVSLIAIDEAHCVSQWGHDFRPAFLQISVLKEIFPDKTFVALTASANARVEKDIITQLKLDQPTIFRQSFARKNISYNVLEVEDKIYNISKILKKYPDPTIIYVRNRKMCIDVSSQLKFLGFTATYFHGGLKNREKEKNMKSWMTEEAQVIVATNAFGMGIDKANVRTVIHMQYAENIESYYQEAGRAGRNGERAFAVVLSSPSDKLNAEGQFLSVLPDKAFLLKVYNKLCNFFQVAYGECPLNEFTFNLNKFCLRYDFPVLKTYNALQFLDREGVLSLTKDYSQKVSLQFLIESKEVLRYISMHPRDEAVILTLLRTYPGIYEYAVKVNTDLVAKKTPTTIAEVARVLTALNLNEIADYTAHDNDSALLFLENRDDEHTINRVAKHLKSQNELKVGQMEAFIHYVTDKTNCKSRIILNYFDEKTTENCGICSYCRDHAHKHNRDITNITSKMLTLLQIQDFDSRELERLLKIPESDIISAIHELLEKETIALTNINKYTLKK